MKNLIKSISKTEWFILVGLSVVLIILTALPYVVGYFMTPAGRVYDGLHALSPGDIAVYYSYINQVSEGNFLVKNLFTSEPQTLGTFNTLWTIPGLFIKFFGWSVILVFQIFRLIWIPILVVVSYLFISYFFQEKIKRLVSLLFLFFSSGVGFYFAGQSSVFFDDQTTTMWWPTDLWISESITFNAIYQSAHFIASLVFMLAIFLFMLLAFENKKKTYVFWAAILSFIYFHFHTYYLPVIFGALGSYLFVLFVKHKKILWTQSWYLFFLIIISFPSVLYHIWLIQNSPVIGQRALQNITLISPLIFVIIGYGFLWLGGALGIYFLLRNKKFVDKFKFLAVWLVVNICLIYSPFPFHSRYTQGLHVILVILTVSGIFDLWDYLKIKLLPKRFDFWVNNKALLGLIFLLCFSPSIILMMARDYYYFIFQPPRVREFLYVPKDLFEACDWLSSQPGGQVVLASDLTSKLVAGLAGQTVFIGHGHETLFYKSKNLYLNWFLFNNENDSAKANFLVRQGIDYIVYSEYEKSLGTFDPAKKNYLKLVFDLQKAKIYQVVK